MLCQEWTLLKRQGHLVTAEPLRCKCWTCELCAPRRKALLQALGRAGQPNTFITLTVRPRPRQSAPERAQALVVAMREMFKRAKRVYGYKRIPFLAVFEKTKRGEPHLHILARCKWIDQRWLSRQMDALIDAPIVDIRRVTSARQMVNYVTKYIGKDPTAFKGCKRYWSSRDWRLPTPQDQLAEELPAATFEVFRGDLEAAATHLRTQHYWVVEQDKTLMAIEWAYYARGPTK